MTLTDTKSSRNRISTLALLIAMLLLGGCTSQTKSAVVVPHLPEFFAGHAEEPSSFVASPLMIESLTPTPGRSRVVTESMIAEAVVEYVVDENGEVIAYRTIETNHPAYAEAVRAWISSARFIPGVKAGQNVTVRVRGRHFVDVSRSAAIKR